MAQGGNTWAETAGQAVVCQWWLYPVRCSLSPAYLLHLLPQYTHGWFLVALPLTCCSSLLAWWLALKTGAGIEQDFLKRRGGDNHVQFSIAAHIVKGEGHGVDGIDEEGGGRVDFRCFRMAFLGLNNFNVPMQVERNKVTHSAIMPDIGINLKGAGIAIEQII